AVELLPRQGRRESECRRYLRGAARGDEASGDIADGRDHDAAGGRQLREGAGPVEAARRGAARGAEGARSAQRRAGRHRAALRDRRIARPAAVASRLMTRSSHRSAEPTRRPPPWWLIASAAAYVLYFALIVWCEVHRPEAPGLLVRFEQGGMLAQTVVPNSPAARAGITPGDLLIAADDHPLRTRLDWLFVAANIDADRAITVRLRRGGNDRLVETTWLLPRAGATYWTRVEGLTHAAVRLSQFIVLTVSLIVAFKRPRARVAVAGAWLLATIAVFSVGLPYGMANAWRALPPPIGWALWLPYLCRLAIAAVMWTFFA